MARALVLTVPLLAAITMGCGPKVFDSLCDDPNAPAACTQTCDPSPGAANTCPGGFHCSPDGACDAQCTPGGSECGAGYTCTDDGRCVDDGSGSNVPVADAAECADLEFTAMPITPSISLLIDRSGSMDDAIGNQTRYQAVREALVGNNGVVTALQSKAFFGASLYSTDAPCPKLYSVPRALDNKATIQSLIDGQSPGGNTPTGPSIDQAVAAFAATPPPAGSPPVIVLATDGLPNGCDTNNSTEAQSVAAAAASFNAGIRLFVLAVGNGINDNHLQQLANAGAGVQPGQPNAPFFVANTPDELRDAFDQIIQGVVSCELTINGTIDQTQAMDGTVKLNGVELMFGTDWELVDGSTIRLLGQACETLKTSANPNVEASFPCNSVIL